jgi:hypothetical protein
VLVVAEVDLAQARVDARVRRGAHRLLQAAQASARVAKRRDWPATLRDHGHGTMRPLRRMPLSCKATA